MVWPSAVHGNEDHAFGLMLDGKIDRQLEICPVLHRGVTDHPGAAPLGFDQPSSRDRVEISDSDVDGERSVLCSVDSGVNADDQSPNLGCEHGEVPVSDRVPSVHDHDR